MKILSFDTSTSVLHLSLLQGQKAVLEREIPPASINRSEVASLLMPQIDEAFREVQWGKRDAELIVVGVGPGSFTGIRVAVITARTLAQILQVPLIGVSLLESTYHATAQQAPAAVVFSTTSNQFYYGAFESSGKGMAPIVEPDCAAPEELIKALSAVSRWFADEKAREAFPDQPTQALPFLKNIATTQAEVALDRLSLSGFSREDEKKRRELTETFSWRNVLPLYLRSPSVTLKKSYAADPNPAHEHR